MQSLTTTQIKQEGEIFNQISELFKPENLPTHKQIYGSISKDFETIFEGKNIYVEYELFENGRTLLMNVGLSVNGEYWQLDTTELPKELAKHIKYAIENNKK